MKRILIKNGSVWDGFSIKKRDILICDGYIERVSRDIEGNADLLFEAENMLVSSGLCDFHTHIRDISPDSIGIDSEKISHPFGVTHLVDASAETGDIGSTGKANTDISVLARVFIEDNRASLGFTEKIIEKQFRYSKELKKYYTTRRRIGFIFSHLGGMSFYLKITDVLAKSAKRSGWMGVPSAISYEKEIFEEAVFRQVTKGLFCGIEVNIPVKYDKYLRNLYGDYMTIPPVEKREQHTAYKIEL